MGNVPVGENLTTLTIESCCDSVVKYSIFGLSSNGRAGAGSLDVDGTWAVVEGATGRGWTSQSCNDGTTRASAGPSGYTRDPECTYAYELVRTARREPPALLLLLGPLLPLPSRRLFACQSFSCTSLNTLDSRCSCWTRVFPGLDALEVYAVNGTARDGASASADGDERGAYEMSCHLISIALAFIVTRRGLRVGGGGRSARGGKFVVPSRWILSNRRRRRR